MASTDLHETLFGDTPLETWAVGKDVDPWATFSSARWCLQRGDNVAAAKALQSILRMPNLESRHYLQAWDVLRRLGHQAPKDDAKHVYGVVVDVPIQSAFDTVAGYEDGRAYYLNYSGASITWQADDGEIGGHVRRLLTIGGYIAEQIGPWEGARPPLDHQCARISMLTPSGLHFGEAPFSVLTQDPLAGPLLVAATELMQALIALTQGPSSESSAS